MTREELIQELTRITEDTHTWAFMSGALADFILSREKLLLEKIEKAIGVSVSDSKCKRCKKIVEQIDEALAIIEKEGDHV